jgi:membrane fusion protein, multidrug efflux system
LGAGALAFVLWRFANQEASAPTPISPVPVVTAQVQQHDEPIVLSGLGTVEALNTASIQSQVTGVLEEVNFTEGQTVKKGDILAKIDPRLYRLPWSRRKDNWPKTPPCTPRLNRISRAIKSLGPKIRSP